jgi:NAD(P)H-nitrite reductase large subunit
MAKRDPENK